MEYALYLIGGIILLFAMLAKVLDIKFKGFTLHKVGLKRVTVVEKALGLRAKVKAMRLKPGLYPIIEIDPFYVIKKANIPMFQYAITFFAGTDESWEDWEINPTHSTKDIDWGITSGIELKGGSSAVIECMLVFWVHDPIKFVYNNDTPVPTMIMLAKSIVREAVSGKLSFSGLMKITKARQKNMITRLRLGVETLNLGITIADPDEDHAFVKNPHPCPDTKKGRAMRFDAKQQGKAAHEIAIGEALADKERGKGLGKKILKAAGLLQLTNDRLLDYDQQKMTVEGLSDKTTVLSGGGNDSMNSMASRLAGAATATAVAITKSQQQPKEPGQKPDADGGDKK